jgi:hypothetical protein
MKKSVLISLLLTGWALPTTANQEGGKQAVPIAKMPEGKAWGRRK